MNTNIKNTDYSMSSKEIKESSSLNGRRSNHFVSAVYRLSRIVPYVLSKHKPRVLELDTFSAVEGEQSQYEATQKLKKYEYEMLGLNRVVPKRVAYREFFDTPDEFDDVVSKEHSQTESSDDETTNDLLDGFLNLISPNANEDDCGMEIGDPLLANSQTQDEPEIEDDEILYIGNSSLNNRTKKTYLNSSNFGSGCVDATERNKPSCSSSCSKQIQREHMVLHSVHLPTSPQVHKTGKPTHDTSEPHCRSEFVNQSVALPFARGKSKVHRGTSNLDEPLTSQIQGTHSHAIMKHHPTLPKKGDYSKATEHRPTNKCIGQTVLCNKTGKLVVHDQTNASNDSYQPKQHGNPTLRHQEDRPGTKVGRCPAKMPRGRGQNLVQSPMHETSQGRDLAGTESNHSNIGMCKTVSVVLNILPEDSRSAEASLHDTKNENYSKSSTKCPLAPLKNITTNNRSKHSARLLKNSECANSSVHEAKTKGHSRSSRKRPLSSIEDGITSGRSNHGTRLKSSQSTIHKAENKRHLRSSKKRPLTAVKDSQCTNSKRM